MRKGSCCCYIRGVRPTKGTTLKESPFGGRNFRDVYVGTFNDAANEKFIAMVSNWSLRFPRVRLGLLVVDGNYRGNTFLTMKRIAFGRFEKVVLITATGEQGSTEGLLRQLGFRGPVQRDDNAWASPVEAGSLAAAPISLHNYVRELAVMHVYKHAMPRRCFGGCSGEW